MASATQRRKLAQDLKHLADTNTTSPGVVRPKTSDAMVARVACDLDARAKRSGGTTAKRKPVRRPTAKKTTKRVVRRAVTRRNPGMTAAQIIGAVTR